MKIIATASAVAACLWFTPASAGFENETIPCPVARDAAVEEALVEAILDIEAAAEALEKFNDRTRAKFERWFGVSDENAVIEVIEFYGGAEGLWADQNIWCPTSSDANADYNNNAIAHVYDGEVIDIFVSPGFFTLPAVGSESRASSVLHELMHSSGADIDPEDYTVEEAEDLARTNPGNARRNAQNLEYFAVDIVHGM